MRPLGPTTCSFQAKGFSSQVKKKKIPPPETEIDRNCTQLLVILGLGFFSGIDIDLSIIYLSLYIYLRQSPNT